MELDLSVAPDILGRRAGNAELIERIVGPKGTTLLTMSALAIIEVGGQRRDADLNGAAVARALDCIRSQCHRQLICSFRPNLITLSAVSWIDWRAPI